jgi:Flp pilus assembly pilin Flp
MLVSLLYAGAQRLVSRVRREDGQALIEYVLIGSLISVVSIILLTWVGFDVADVLNSIENALNGDDAVAPTAPAVGANP